MWTKKYRGVYVHGHCDKEVCYYMLRGQRHEAKNYAAAQRSIANHPDIKALAPEMLYLIEGIAAHDLTYTEMVSQAKEIMMSKNG